MVGANMQNEFLIAMVETLTSDAGLAAATAGFESCRGDFAARFEAAVVAVAAQNAKPEIFIEIPDRPEEMPKGALDELVRPAAGFLRSYPSKPDLLAELAAIKRRQEDREDWIPRVDVNGQPITMPGPVEERLLQNSSVTAFPELGTVPVQTPAGFPERPELPAADGGIGQLEIVLYTVLGIAGRHTGETISLNADANRALVPEEMRWWHSPEMPDPTPLDPAADPGVASEILATAPTLGGVTIIDATPDSLDAVTAALEGAASWRHSGRWILDTWDHGESAGIFATARASIGAWEADGACGLVVYVGGAGLHENDGNMSNPGLLHTYLLSITRAADGTDAIGAVRRIVLSCPGHSWCRRGGCPISSHNSDAAVAVAVIAEPAETATAAQHHGGWPAKAYDALYGAAHGDDDYATSVIDVCEMAAAATGWKVIGRSAWDGGIEDLLLRREQRFITLSYDPLTRQIQLADGRHSLEMLVDVLAEEGVITGDVGNEVVETGDDAVEKWELDTLIAANDLLRGRIAANSLSPQTPQVTLLGLHPHGDGSLRVPGSEMLLEAQVRMLLDTARSKDVSS